MKPTRRISPPGTYFVTTSTQAGRAILQRDAAATLFVHTLYEYRLQERFRLHAFVVMPEHAHLIITPSESLERTLQFIKGGFSFRASRQLGLPSQVWARGFTDHRIRDENDFLVHREYTHMNPVRRGLVNRAEEFPFSSANPAYEIDPLASAAKAALLVAGGWHG